MKKSVETELFLYELRSILEFYSSVEYIDSGASIFYSFLPNLNTIFFAAFFTLQDQQFSTCHVVHLHTLNVKKIYILYYQYKL